MKTNWAEKVWVNGPLRVYFQQREVEFFKSAHQPAELPRVLEVGCGQGVGVGLIVRHFRPESVEAIDIDPVMVRRAQHRFRAGRRDGTQITIRLADAEELPFAEESMDAVFNFGIIHHLEDWQRGIGEIARVLKPGGAYYFEEIYPALYANLLMRYLVTHPVENRFQGPQYRCALQEAGLRLLHGYRESRYMILGVALKTAEQRR